MMTGLAWGRNLGKLRSLKSALVVLVGLAALPCAAADLDEEYRPLPAKGQSVWTFELSTHDDWYKTGYNGWANYNGVRFMTPMVSMDVGLTDKLRLSFGGTYTDYRTDRGFSHPMSSTGSLALTYRPTRGFEASLGYETSFAGLTWNDWEPTDPDYRRFGDSRTTRDRVVLAFSWLTHPTESYELLVPDLNGLTKPLLDPGQSLLAGTLSVERNHSSYADHGYVGTQYSGDASYVDSDNVASLNLGWRFGLARSWETEVTFSHTNPYARTLTQVSVNSPWEPPLRVGVESLSQIDSLACRLSRRWGQTLQISGVLGYSRRAWDGSSDGIPMGFPEQAGNWKAALEVTALTKPSRRGQPLKRDLDGFRSPLLDPGQFRWDGRAEWSQTRYRATDRAMGGLVEVGYGAAQWKISNAVTVGLGRALQLQGSLNINPLRNPGIVPVEWSHYTASLDLVCRPSPMWEVKASYEAAYDYHRYSPYYGLDNFNEHILQVVRVGASFVW
jgi:hypothetical protein